jgi:Tfp pilus assembly protein PilX
MRVTSQLRRTGRRDERGQALAVLMSVFLVIMLLSVALLNRVDGDLNNTALQGRIQSARSLAQSGVADALFQIDQQGSSPASFCNEANSGGACTFSGVPAGVGANSSIAYTARYSSSTGDYTVFSRGTYKGTQYAVQATIAETPILQNAVYGGAYVTFNGNSTTDVNVTDAYGRPVTGTKVGIATGPGGTLTCNGPTDLNAIYVNYGGSISKCTPVENLGPIYDPQEPSQTCPAAANPYGAPPTPCMPSTASACTAMGAGVTGTDATGYTVTGTTTLEPGIYVCRGGLTMTGTVKVDYKQNPLQNNGQVEIFVFPPVGSTTSPNITLTGSTINACETTGTGATGTEPATCNGGLIGDPTDVQIYGWGSGNAYLGAANVNAVFWGPGMLLKTNGAAQSLNWTGGIILGGVEADGSVSFTLNYDQRLLSEFQVTSWQISNYLQTSPNFSIP